VKGLLPVIAMVVAGAASTVTVTSTWDIDGWPVAAT
jgi:hypothetical protein